MEVNIRRAFTALAVRVLPFYVNQAQSVRENGFEISFSGNGLLTFYRWLCGYLGLEGAPGAGSTIEDSSSMY
jgi:hypothetical protein